MTYDARARDIYPSPWCQWLRCYFKKSTFLQEWNYAPELVSHYQNLSSIYITTGIRENEHKIEKKGQFIALRDYQRLLVRP